MSQHDRDLEGDLATRSKKKTARPRRYKVIFHNDDYTTMEFVVFVLEQIYRKSGPEAAQIMLHVHQRGAGVAGTYPYEIAETKVATTLELAKEHGHPLMVTMEPE